jgi:hypothetical protein
MGRRSKGTQDEDAGPGDLVGDLLALTARVAALELTVIQLGGGALLVAQLDASGCEVPDHVCEALGGGAPRHDVIPVDELTPRGDEDAGGD